MIRQADRSDKNQIKNYYGKKIQKALQLKQPHSFFQK